MTTRKRRDATLDAAERRRLGAHYTPYPLARRVVLRGLLPHLLHHCPACDTANNILRVVVVDPACGDGVFLQAAEDILAEWLCEAYRIHGEVRGDGEAVDIDECRRRVQRECLVGWDIDPGAAELTQQRFPHCEWVECRDALFDEDIDLDGRPTAFVGNPPFMGGGRISGTLGREYRERLDEEYPSSHGNADLCAYFFLQAVNLLDRSASKGTVSFIATNTIGQGDTRQTGLAYLLQTQGCLIYCADRSLRWPGDAKVCVSIVHLCNNALGWEAFPESMLDHAIHWPWAWPSRLDWDGRVELPPTRVEQLIQLRRPERPARRRWQPMQQQALFG